VVNGSTCDGPSKRAPGCRSPCRCHRFSCRSRRASGHARPVIDPPSREPTRRQSSRGATILRANPRPLARSVPTCPPLAVRTRHCPTRNSSRWRWAHWVSRIVYVAATLDLAGRLANSSMTADEVAGPTGTDSLALYRFMRSLATLGILSESDDRRFALTPLGEALKAGAPGAAGDRRC